MSEKSLVPELRFPEFIRAWNPSKLGDIARFRKGKGISKADIKQDGNQPCIRYGELYTTYNELIDEVVSYTDINQEELVLSEENDVIIPASGESNIDIATAACVRNSGIALGGDLNIIKTNLEGVFLSYYLNSHLKYKVASYAQGNSVVHLYSTQLKLLDLNVPSLEEQQKTASFLSAVDQRIALLEKKKELLEQYKKGVMQKIFSQEIRFKDEHGNDFPDWEEKKLGEVATTVSGLSGKTKEDFGEGVPYVQYKQVFDSSYIKIEDCGLVKLENGEKQSTLKKGDVLLTTSSETANEVGTASVIIENLGEIYLNSFCFGLRFKKDILSPVFSQFLFRSEGFRKIVVPLAQGSTRYNLSKSSLMKLVISIPRIEEQIKIGSFLQKLLNQIEGVESSVNEMKVFKKGLLQKMFV